MVIYPARYFHSKKCSHVFTVFLGTSLLVNNTIENVDINDYVLGKLSYSSSYQHCERLHLVKYAYFTFMTVSLPSELWKNAEAPTIYQRRLLLLPTSNSQPTKQQILLITLFNRHITMSSRSTHLIFQVVTHFFLSYTQ